MCTLHVLETHGPVQLVYTNEKEGIYQQWGVLVASVRIISHQKEVSMGFLTRDHPSFLPVCLPACLHFLKHVAVFPADTITGICEHSCRQTLLFGFILFSSVFCSSCFAFPDDEEACRGANGSGADWREGTQNVEAVETLTFEMTLIFEMTLTFEVNRGPESIISSFQKFSHFLSPHFDLLSKNQRGEKEASWEWRGEDG